MKAGKVIAVLILLNVICLISGCWNYREIDQLAVVAGVAVDEGEKARYKLTIELADLGSGQEIAIQSKVLTTEGNTIFDAVRNAIATTGKKLYWSHAKVVIVGDRLARKGVAPILDWFNRDAETRSDIVLMVAKDRDAAEIFAIKPASGKVTSFIVADLIKNQRSLSKAPRAEIWQFTNELGTNGIMATAPVITLVKDGEEQKPNIEGTAIFKLDHLQGFLNGEESKAFLFIRDQVEGGVLNVKSPGGEAVALEIFDVKTELKPEIHQGKLVMKIRVESTVAIDEIEGYHNVIDPGGSKGIEQIAQQALKNQIQKVIRKAQKEYGADIFGFGAQYHADQPRIWKQVEKEWDDYFPALETKVSVKVHIRNSAMMLRTIKVGD